MAPSHYTRLILQERPKGMITSKTLRRDEAPISELNPGPGQVVVKTVYISLDPTQRTWMRDEPGYVPPVQIGEVMRAIGIGSVVKAGPNTNLAPGEYVTGSVGLQEYAVLQAQQVNKIDLVPGSELIDFLGPMGLLGGLTAYFGLFEVANIKKGETIVVSAAAGSVGSLVVQFAKLAGARVVGLTGDDDKARYVKNELGADIVYNYKKPGWKEQFDDQVGLADVYFENVGGEITDFILTRMKDFGRVAACGAISDYNVDDGRTGIRNYLEIVLKRLRVEGFIVTDFVSKIPEAHKEIVSWLSNGFLKRKYHVIEGLDKAADSLNLLFTGKNQGKLILKIADPGEV